MRDRLDRNTTLAALAAALALLVAAACSSSDGVTPVCTDAGPNADRCFTPVGDAAFGDDGGASTSDAADETAADAPAE